MSNDDKCDFKLKNTWIKYSCVVTLSKIHLVQKTDLKLVWSKKKRLKESLSFDECY